MVMVFLISGTTPFIRAEAATVFCADGTPLIEDALTPPDNPIPVLFVHGHDPNPDPQHPNYRKNFHDPRGDLPSFKLALDLAENRCLGIEPYYIHFGDAEADHQRSIDIDAFEIQEAVNLILERHRLRDPDNPDLKLAIIAFSKGSISARKYLKQLNDAGSPIPVSEFIAIAPPNHGLNLPLLFGPAGYPSALQLNNGYTSNCFSFNDESQDFIENLNGHDIEHSQSAAASYPSEAPGSRSDGSPADEGVLYAALYAANNGDFVGGSMPSNDCQGRVLAKNLAPHAVNMDDIEMPTEPPGDSFFSGEQGARHQNTVHHPAVIFRALYTVVHHQTPAPGTAYNLVGNVPVIPLPVAGPPNAAVALLFDTSGSMAWSHEGVPGVAAARQRLSLARQAAIPFLDMLAFFNPCRAVFGIARFPRQPYQGCLGEVVAPLAPVQSDTIAAAIETTLPALTAAGNTPLLAGIDTATGMFGGENRKALVLLSDGFHNCPIGSGLDDMGQAADRLAANAIRTYAIGFGQPGEVPHDILAHLAGRTQGGYYDVTTAAGFDPLAWDPATALQAAYKSILMDALQLNAAADPAGLILPGERRMHEFSVSDLDRKLAIFVSWASALEPRPELVIRASDGREVLFRQDLPGIGFSEGPNFIVVKIDSAFLKRPGMVSGRSWSLELFAPVEGKGRAPIPYQWSAIADSALALKGEVATKSATAGATLTLTARLTQNGRPPILPATVWVRVARPLQAVGNWLWASRVSMDELARIPEKRGEETLSPLMRKIIYLSEFRKQPFQGRTAIETVVLYDDGTHGDALAGDGVYTGQYAGTIVAGTYAFEFNASGRSTAGIPFERNQRMERNLAVKTTTINADAIRLPAAQKQFDNFEITLRPADVYGNLLGPGRQHLILWEATQGEFTEAAVDHLDGTYSRKLKVASGTKASALDLRFLIGDAPFRLNLGKALHTSTAVPVASLILLLFMVVVILLRLVTRRGR
jgi:hypothetical protein